MSDRMTSIKLRTGYEAGWAEWGRKTHADMVRIYKDRARREMESCMKILSAKDSDFIVETYIGVYVQHKKQEVAP